MTWKKAAVCSLKVHKELGMGEEEWMLSSTKPETQAERSSAIL